MTTVRLDVIVLAAALSLPLAPARAQSSLQQSPTSAGTARACVNSEGHFARCGPSPEVWHECRAALEPFGRCRDDPSCFDSEDRVVKCVTPVRYREFLTPAVPTTSLEPGDFYPALAMRQNEQGVTGLRLVIAADGRVSQCTVADPSGSTTLDTAACALATHRWRFTPATYRGQAIESVYRRNITWRIRSIN